VPACTSYECATDTADPYSKQYGPIGYNPHNLNSTDSLDVLQHLENFDIDQQQYHALAEDENPSVPACTSYECQTDTMDPYSKKWPMVGINPHDLNMTNNGDAVKGLEIFHED
jgi:hypothetical protein